MEGLRRIVLLAPTVLFFAAVMLPKVAAERYIVGGNMGWSPGVNYTVWAQDNKISHRRFSLKQTNVLEVSKADYETCNSEHPLHDWTTGVGRDVVPLDVAKTFYFISDKGFCSRGMKLAIHVDAKMI